MEKKHLIFIFVNISVEINGPMPIYMPLLGPCSSTNNTLNDLNNSEAKDEDAKRKMMWNKHKTSSDWRAKLWIEVRTLSHVWQSRLDSLRGAAHTPRVFRFQRSTRPSDKISPYQRKRLLALQPTVTTLDHSGQLWSAARGVSEVSGRRYDPWQEKRKQKKSQNRFYFPLDLEFLTSVPS